MIRRMVLIGIVSLSLCLSLSNGLMAPTASAAPSGPPQCYSSLLGLPHWYEYLELGSKNGDPCAIIGPMEGEDFNWAAAAPRVAAAVVSILLRIAALLAVVFTIYGGFMYMLSQGEPDATKKAKGTIVAASIGLVISMFASVIIGFIGGVLWR